MRNEFKMWQRLPALTQALSLRERENRPPSQCESERADCSGAPCKTKTSPDAVPSPRGEGEVGRDTNFSEN